VAVRPENKLFVTSLPDLASVHLVERIYQQPSQSATVLHQILCQFVLSQCFGMFSTMQIREIVQQVLSTGFLSIEAEDQLRRMLSSKYDREDFQAFMQLQNAAMIGSVRQESRLAGAPPLQEAA
jgi:hypothetical protein